MVTFDRPLREGPVDHPNWQARYAFLAWFGIAAIAIDHDVRVTMVSGLPDIGADVCRFSPPPFDVVSARSGLPAAAFSDFTIT